RHWHGLGVMLWVLNGLVYVVLLFATGLWKRIIPTSWDIFPQAWESFKIYAGFGTPALEYFQPYDALQMLTYTAVVFVLAPLMILTAWLWHQLFVRASRGTSKYSAAHR